jgi:4,5:9,10-diseco-3-hydroxy-5,9,17-trioxoandrosta-1(10),2-diene-4-oate hydrolase
MTKAISEAGTSREVQLPGVKIHYNEVGTGAPLICLHGGGPGASSWSNFASNIDAFSRKHRLLLVDLPQFGKSEKVQIDGLKLTFHAGVLRNFMDALGIDRAAFVGNSFGGQVGVKVAIDHPERVRSLVIIGSAPVVQSLFCPMPVEGVKLIANYYRGDGGPTIDKMRQILKTLVFDPNVVTEQMVRERYEASIDPDTIRVNTGPAGPRQDLTAEFSRVKAPTLIVWGMDDRAGALDVGLLMTRAFPDAEMHIFGRCGHWAQVEHADKFNELVLNFVSRH